MDASAPLSAGDAVRAFYHANDHPGGYRFVRLLDGPPEVAPEASAAGSRSGGDLAAVGLTTGWMPATVAEDWRAPADAAAASAGGEDRVLVKFHGRFLDAYKQEENGNPVNGLYWRVPRHLVRRVGIPQPAAELSILVVRWWDYFNRRRGSPSHNVANEDMLLDALQNAGSPHAAFGAEGRYEVYSAFARNAADLDALGASMAGAMRGKRKAAFYFLWPTQRPSVERRMPGCVPAPSLLALMERMEAQGVPSRFPHEVKLYRQLAGKTWVPRVCAEQPELRVPKTVSVTSKDFDADSFKVAERALLELYGAGDLAARRGVAKLGFSWMGEDVRPFTGPTELVKALSTLFDGCPPDAMCLVQERVENVVCELRFVCSRDRAAGEDAVKRDLVRMRMHNPRHSDATFALTSAHTMGFEEAAECAFVGKREALEAAEKEADRLADLWFQWLKEEGHGVPANLRLDFLVALAPEVKLWTVEVCESGGSLCGLSPAVRAAALLNECLCEGPSAPPPAGFPQQLPPQRQPLPAQLVVSLAGCRDVRGCHHFFFAFPLQ
eukprot:TRINITY_DN10767_c0_g2_i2.p1 TRINITY_DN10767_c0_g2~~TRINITY_DN10767_c0_g2_i2.p1  ORF type:complete len:552 (+),score=131.03 TRINITY_DN10767_c0_g2_i2:73-1728(+)